MDTFHELIQNTIKETEYYIDKYDIRPKYMTDKQLNMIIEELEKMDKIRNCEIFFPYYPKGVADCWDFEDPLAEKLLFVIDIYRKL